MTYLYPFRRGAGRRSQNYGASPGWILNGVQVNPSGGHTGFDDAVPGGTPVYAAADGVIDAARTFPTFNNEWLYGPMGGLTLVLNCGDNKPSFGYAHLSKALVREGERVRKGQIIALSGNSGTATTGFHCHVEALPPRWAVGNGTYGRVNPDLYFDENPSDITAQSTTLEADDMPTAKEVAKETVALLLAHPVDRQGAGMSGTVTLAAILAWYDANNAAIPSNVWSYRNPGGEETRDAYQVLRDIPTNPELAAAMIPDDIAQDVIELLADRLKQ